MSVPCRWVYGLNAISSKIVTDLFLEIVRLSLKFIRKHGGLRMAKAVLKKNKIGGLKTTWFQDLLSACDNQGSVVLTSHQQIDRWKRAPRNRPTFMVCLFVFWPRHQSNPIGREVFSTNSAGVSEYPHGKMDILPLSHIKHKN